MSWPFWTAEVRAMTPSSTRFSSSERQSRCSSLRTRGLVRAGAFHEGRQVTIEPSPLSNNSAPLPSLLRTVVPHQTPPHPEKAASEPVRKLCRPCENAIEHPEGGTFFHTSGGTRVGPASNFFRPRLLWKLISLQLGEREFSHGLHDLWAGPPAVGARWG